VVVLYMKMALKIFIFALLSLLLPACNAVIGSLYPLFLVTMRAHYLSLCRCCAATDEARTVYFCSNKKVVLRLSSAASKFVRPISYTLY